MEESNIFGESLRTIKKLVHFVAPALFAPVAFLLFFLFIFSNLLGLVAKKKAKEEEGSLQTEGVTVVIPNWNGKALLEECLPSVVQAIQCSGASHEVIVVDNNSSDDSVEFLETTYPQIKVLRSSTNLGFSGGCNLGVEHAENEIVVLLNNDMKVDKNFLAPLLAPFKDPSAFAVSSQIFFWDKTARRQETGKTSGRFHRGFFEVGHDVPKNNGLEPILYAGGGSSAYDKKKFLQLAGFDEMFAPFYGEDMDISYRAWKRGWKVLFEPKSIVYHKHRGTISKFGDRYIEGVVVKNRFLFIWKNVTDPGLILRHILFLPFNLISRSLKGEPSFTPLWLATMQLPRVLRERRRQRKHLRFSDKQVLKFVESPFSYKEEFEEPRPFAQGTRLNILFLCPYFPYPPSHGGAVRMFNLIKELSRKHNIYLLSFLEAYDKEEDISYMKKFCREVHVVRRDPPRPDLNPFSVRSRFLREFDSPDMSAKFLEVLGKSDIDVVQIEYTQMAQYCPSTKHAVTLLTEHDVSFLSFQRRFLITKPFGSKLKALLEWLRVFDYELRVCQRFDTVLAVTRKEAEFLQSYLPKTKISSEAPTGVDVDWFKGNSQEYVPGTLLYLGNFLHDPNVDAILYFCDKIYPLIRARRPSVTLTIAGRLPPDRVLALARDDSIKVTGFVEDIRELYWKHAVFVVPIRFGAGVRVKILEAMAAGIPVVSTSVGCEGIEGISSESVLVADSPEVFAQRTIDALEDRELRERLVAASRRIVEEEYDWKSIARNLEGVYQRLLVQKRGRETDEKC